MTIDFWLWVDIIKRYNHIISNEVLVMKKLFKTVLALTMVLAICFAFAGCKVVVAEGEWQCNKMRATFSYVDAEVDLLQFGGNMTIVLNDDNTMTIKGHIPAALPFDGYFANIDDSGKWSLDGDVITLDGANDYNLTWDNNKLIYTFDKQYADPDKMVGGKAATVTFTLEFIPA